MKTQIENRIDSLQAIYNAHAQYFFLTTGCDPMTFAEWVAIDEAERPGMGC